MALLLFWNVAMRKNKVTDLSIGATVYCRRTNKRCEVLRHFVSSNIDHVVVAFDVSERTPRQITLSFSAAKDRFASSPTASFLNINFLPKLLAS